MLESWRPGRTSMKCPAWRGDERIVCALGWCRLRAARGRQGPVRCGEASAPQQRSDNSLGRSIHRPTGRRARKQRLPSLREIRFEPCAPRNTWRNPRVLRGPSRPDTGDAGFAGRSKTSPTWMFMGRTGDGQGSHLGLAAGNGTRKEAREEFVRRAGKDSPCTRRRSPLESLGFVWLNDSVPNRG